MTYTKEEAKIEIAQLVEDFRAHEDTLGGITHKSVNQLIYELWVEQG